MFKNNDVIKNECGLPKKISDQNVPKLEKRLDENQKNWLSKDWEEGSSTGPCLPPS